MLKVGKYIIYRTEKGRLVIAHEAGEAMEITEEALAYAIERLWREKF